MTLTCDHCSAGFEWIRPVGKRGRPPAYCSVHCKRERHNAHVRMVYHNGPSLGRAWSIRFKTCVICDRRFVACCRARKLKIPGVPTYVSTTCCRPECVAAIPLLANAASRRPRGTKKCGQCGEEYVASREGQSSCSRKCSQRENGMLRRAVKAGRFAERIGLGEIAERDGWICGICSKAVDRNAHSHKDKPSIDHIVPISKGGQHTKDNVQLAHVGCNSGKKARIITTPAAEFIA